MGVFVNSLRTTVAGAVGAAGHIAWYVEWQSGRRCARSLPPQPHTQILEQRAA
jgi:hypothetical protein